jgi:hypothetical protein|tara:strand:+ start:1288 stop:1635 length:348 start_codon:yes stop_codon:yes gene_type:complete
MKSLIFMIAVTYAQMTNASVSLVCTNVDDAYVYSGYLLDSAKAFKVPANSYAIVDVMIQPIDGQFVLSGSVTNNAGNKLTASNGNQRWYMLVDEWYCRRVTGAELEANKKKGNKI